MKKEKFVTRTVNGYTVNALFFDMEEGKAKEITLDYSADFIPAKGAEIVRKDYESDVYKVVAIKSFQTWEKLYGLPESVFMERARVLPPRGMGGRTRERLVTRTIKTYSVTALCFDMGAGKPTTCEFTLSAMDYENQLSYVRGKCETDEIKIITVNSVEEKETLYAMSEKDFVLWGEVLPARAKKEESEESEEAEN